MNKSHPWLKNVWKKEIILCPIFYISKFGDFSELIVNFFSGYTLLKTKFRSLLDLLDSNLIPLNFERERLTE